MTTVIAEFAMPTLVRLPEERRGHKKSFGNTEPTDPSLKAMGRDG